jgi:hypothetical protein
MCADNENPILKLQVARRSQAPDVSGRGRPDSRGYVVACRTIEHSKRVPADIDPLVKAKPDRFQRGVFHCLNDTLMGGQLRLPAGPFLRRSPRPG